MEYSSAFNKEISFFDNQHMIFIVLQVDLSLLDKINHLYQKLRKYYNFNIKIHNVKYSITIDNINIYFNLPMESLGYDDESNKIVENFPIITYNSIKYNKYLPTIKLTLDIAHIYNNLLKLSDRIFINYERNFHINMKIESQ